MDCCLSSLSFTTVLLHQSPLFTFLQFQSTQTIMRPFVGASLIIGASAAAVPQDQCCFQLSASGSASGSIGQLGDGQNRIGGGFPPATYCISNGGITDKNGRGCILTPPTTQFQCDVGATPTYGFSIGQGGLVEYKGSQQFYACPATDNGEYNLYTTPVAGQAKCVKVALSTGGKCENSSAPKSSAPAETPKTPAQSVITTTQIHTTTIVQTVVETTCVAQSTPVVQTTMKTVVESPPARSSQPAESQKPSGTKPTPSESACPAALSGPYQTPHLIVPVSSKQPNTAYGTQYNATISPDECTIFNFDIPTSYSGKTCSAIFLFPEQSQLQTSAYTFSGSGELVFSELSNAANQQTTWSNAPSMKSELDSVAVKPGNSYVISTSSCAAGTTQSIEICSSNGLSLQFFEDYNPSPIGLYITAC